MGNFSQLSYINIVGEIFSTVYTYYTGFYTKLNVWGSLGLNFDYDGGPINKNGGPIFQYVYIIGFVLLIIKSRYTRLKGNDRCRKTSGHFRISTICIDLAS